MVQVEKKFLTTRKMAIIGILGGISMILGMTPLGFIPINPTMKATIMHIPVIIGAVLEGPIVGLSVGLLFGLFSIFQNITQPNLLSFIFINPIIAIIPRLFIAIGAYYSYVLVYKFSKNNFISGMISGALGSFINTAGVLGLAYILYAVDVAKALGQNPNQAGKAILFIATAHGIPEMIISMFICAAIIKSLKKIKK